MFEITMTISQYDHDNWMHWTEQHNVAYHRTREGAERKVSALILKEIVRLEAQLKAAVKPAVPDYIKERVAVEGPKYLNGTIYSTQYLRKRRKHWRNKIALALNNRVLYGVGENGEENQESNLFTIREIEVGD